MAEGLGTAAPAPYDWRTDFEHAARDLLGDQGEMAARKRDWRPGSFVHALLQAMYLADATNLDLLARSYPAHAGIVHLWKNDPNGYAEVHGIAGWEPGS